MAAISGGKKLEQVLADIASKMGNGVVSVGFMEGATYPDGTPVAAVAFWNEFGVPEHKQPPRPFFRRMISAESPGWAAKLSGLSKATKYDGHRVLSLMGEDIKGALQQSINSFQSPELAERTVAAKGFAKPLIDTSHMLNSITYKVED